MKTSYEKPILIKEKTMTFMFEPYKCQNVYKCNKEKKDNDCKTSCMYHTKIGCRQCSGCHGCR